MFKLALRNIFRHRVRTSLTLAAIAFGVIGLVLSGGFLRDIFIQLGEVLIHTESGHLQVARAGYFSYGSRSPNGYFIEDPSKIQDAIAAIPEVDDTMDRVQFSGLLNNGRSDWPILGEGVEPAKEAKLGSLMHIIAGRQLAEGDTTGLLIGEGVAKALKLAPGADVTLLLNTPEGALNSLDFVVVGVFQTFSRDFDARAVRISLKAAHELLGTRGANIVVVSLKKTSDTDYVAAKIRALVDKQKFEVKTWVQLNDFYEKTISLYDQQFGFLQMIILAMLLLSVVNSVNMTVFERVGEFGTMLALGNRGSHVFRLIMTESVMLGIIGGGLGVVLGTVLAEVISAVGIPMPPPPNANVGYVAHIQVEPRVLVVGFAIGLIATTLAALLPAMRVSRIHVVEALGRNV